MILVLLADCLAPGALAEVFVLGGEDLRAELDQGLDWREARGEGTPEGWNGECASTKLLNSTCLEEC